MTETLVYALLIAALKDYLGLGNWVWWAFGIFIIVDNVIDWLSSLTKQ